MVPLRFGWTMSGVLELRADSLTVLLIQSEPITVHMLKMLESDAVSQAEVRCIFIEIRST